MKNVIWYFKLKNSFIIRKNQFFRQLSKHSQTSLTSGGENGFKMGRGGESNNRGSLEIMLTVPLQVIDVNLKGTFLVTQTGAGLMKDQGIQGSIVNIASIVGRLHYRVTHKTWDSKDDLLLKYDSYHFLYILYIFDLCNDWTKKVTS